MTQAMLQITLMAIAVATAIAQDPCAYNHCGPDRHCVASRHSREGFICVSRHEAADPCAAGPCQNGGTCIRTSYSDYRCECAYGYSGNNCEVQENNACTINPCQNGGTCIVEAYGYRCECASGCSGTNCELSSGSASPCDPNPCRNGGTCELDGYGGYKCKCPTSCGGKHCEKHHPKSSAPMTFAVSSQWKKALFGCVIALLSSRLMGWMNANQQ